MAVQSPGFILFDTGNNFLVRPVVDNLLPISSAHFSVAFTFDPTILGAGHDGTIVSKHNAAGNQASWKVSYVASTGIVTISLWSSLTGAAACSRALSVALFVRSVVVFAYDGAAVTLNGYANGSLANGTLTGTVPATITTCTEPLAVAAEATTGTPINIWQGALFHLIVWNSTLSSGDVGTILLDGVTPAPLKGPTYNLQLNYEHTAVEQDFADKVQKWRESVSVYEKNLFGGAASGTVPRAQQFLGGSLLIANQWNSFLTDVGFANQALSSTYIFAPPYRYYGGALTAPNRATFRAKVNDITIWVKCRRILASTNTIFIDLLGISLTYTLSTHEFFAITGTDTSVTLQNKKHSFGTGIWATLIEGLSADVVLRYNAVDKTCDLFVNGTKFAPTVTTSSLFATNTALTLSQTADFQYAAVVPACLSDAQVAQMLMGNPIPAYRAKIQDVGYIPEPYAMAEQDAPLPADRSTEEINVNSTNAASPGVLRGRGVDAPYLVVEAPGRQYTDPLLVATAVSANSSHIVTAVASAGPTDAYQTVSWWEIELDGTTRVLTPPRFSISFYAARVSDSTSFPVPVGENWNGKRIRFVVQAALDASQIWYSNYLTMTGLNFDNVIPTTPIYVDPNLVVLYAEADETHHAVFSGQLGAVTSDLIAFPPIVYWWEIEMVPGKFYAFIDETVLSSVLTRTTRTDSLDIPLGISFRGKKVRLAARSMYDYTQVWRSAAVDLIDPGFDNGTFNPLPLPPGPQLPAPLGPTTGVPGPGVVHKRTLDYSTRR